MKEDEIHLLQPLAPQLRHHPRQPRQRAALGQPPGQHGLRRSGSRPVPAQAARAIGRDELNFLDVGEERVHRAWVRRSHCTRKVLQLPLSQKRDRASYGVPRAEGLDDRGECRGDGGRSAAHEARGLHPHVRREEGARGRGSHIVRRGERYRRTSYLDSFTSANRVRPIVRRDESYSMVPTQRDMCSHVIVRCTLQAFHFCVYLPFRTMHRKHPKRKELGKQATGPAIQKLNDAHSNTRTSTTHDAHKG